MVRRSSSCAVLLASGAILCAWGAPALATGTVAGTTISNTASATYTAPGGTTETVPSNKVDIRVDELLNVKVATAEAGDVAAQPGSTGQVVKFTVTNTGNGSEAFRLNPITAIGGDAFDPAATSIVIDSNNNGVYDAGQDTVYVAGSNDPVLAPDATIRVFVLSSIPAGTTDGQRGQIDLTATANTGSGTPGTTFAGKGDGGGDAVVGATTASGRDKNVFVVSAATVALVKSATVVDPFGAATSVPRRGHHLQARRQRQRQRHPRQSGDRRRGPDRHDLCRRQHHVRGIVADRCQRRRCGRVRLWSHRGPLRLGRRRLDANRHLQSQDQLRSSPMIRHALALALVFAPLPALAANDVALTSEMFVERAVPQAGGAKKIVLEKPKSVPPGAKLVFVLTYRNAGTTPAANFVVTNPMPAGVAFDSADGGAVVSTDGGLAYGPLAAARARAADGTQRPARPEDVTHVRWVLKAPIPVGGSGKLSFKGQVK